LLLNKKPRKPSLKITEITLTLRTQQTRNYSNSYSTADTTDRLHRNWYSRSFAKTKGQNYHL